ncbi:hypothetical protein ABPG72_013155 [Tetrahymena utriculariae]
MGCTNSCKADKKKFQINDALLQHLVEQFDIYYEEIYNIRFKLYDDLEIPHLIDEQQELSCVNIDENLLFERLKQMKEIYSKELYLQTYSNLKQSLKKIKEMQARLAPFLKSSNKVLLDARKKSLSKRTETLIQEGLLKRTCIVAYFKKPTFNEKSPQNTYRSHTSEQNQDEAQTYSCYINSYRNYKLSQVLQKKLSLIQQID